ncbi:von Willebrand factor type A domain [Anaerobutyricum hallii]|uniref:von Willebrand factor type A domain n=1 Tax=Anaerobutyricum hallii TaxID=39488 RepID=A0A285PUD3_9FIRM|nr:SpaA isopeptide-forming pilin-related protein [Anaerobutyricum hallii]SOB73194.1 von Willebrand factor type A domain [Anaerobutyricum hallii]
MVKDTEGNEMPKYPDGTYVVSSAKTGEADSTEQTAKTSSVIREYKSDDVNVTVTAENEADLPADAKLVVKPIELSQKAQENVEQAAIKEEKKAIKNILAYDIHFEADGKEVQPGATVKVSVDVPEIKAGANASVFHVDDKNKVENMDGDVDKKGNVVFETTHFSQYVIVNQSETNSDISVTIEHYKVSEDSNHQYTNDDKIYADDMKTLKVGDSIEEYNKATNWTVSKVVVQSQTGQAERTYTGEVAKNTRIPLAQSCTVKVYYTENTTSKDGGVKFYDYTVQAGQNGNTKYSINMDANYPEGSNESNRLSVGESKRNYPEYQYTCAVNNIENANAWTGHPKDGQEVTLVKGLLKGLDEHGSPKFNYYEPGFFKNEDQSEEINGKTVYTRRVINDYKLTFSQEGDTYTLSSVKKPNVNNGNTTYTEVASGGEHFFPLDDIDHSAEQEKGNPHESTYKSDCTNRENHNYYFGMRYDVDFKLGDYIGPLNYSFTGDDDLWVLYDGQVVLDLGGIHDKASDTVDLWKTILNKTSYGYKDKKEYSENLSQKDKEAVHTITVLYMERGAGESNCTMNFTLPSAELVNVSEQKKTTLTLKKQSIKGENLKGAKFQIKKNAIVISEAESDEKGDVTLNNLPVGEYILKETKAPNTYATPTNEWIVKVTLGTDGNSVARLYKEDTVTEVDKTGSAYKIVNLTPEEIMECSKTAKVKDWDQRTYDITIDAASKVSNTTITTQKPVADIMLVLDVSGSMGYNIETYDQVAMNTPDGRKLLNEDETYYLEVNGKYKEMFYYRRTWYVEGWNKASDYGENCKIYEKKVGTTRLAALKNSVNQFIDDTKKNSPDSKIGITAFSSAGYGDHGQSKELMQVGVGDNDTTLKDFVNSLDANGGTDPAVGLTNAKDALVNANDENPKYVILFTDGKPTGGGSEWNTTAQTNAETSANALKNAGYTVYTIGFDLNEQAKTFLAGGTYDGTTYPGIASSPDCAKSANDAASLNAIFKEIQSEVTNNSDITGATITDVIDPRFVVVDDDNNVITKERLQEAENQEIKLKNGGVVSLDKNGNQVVTWTDQTIPNKNNKKGKKNWKNTITVKAKDEYIGGNNIPTNISPDSKIITEYGEAILPQPKVNVKADLLVNNTDRTIFLGENTPYSNVLLKELFDTDNPQGYVDGVLKPYTMGSDGKAFNSDDFSIQWYSDTECTKPLTLDQIRADQPKNTKKYYLKVTYDKIDPATPESNQNTTTTTTKDGKTTTTEHFNNKPILAHNSEVDKARTYGVYTVNVVSGEIQISKELIGDSPSLGNDGKTFTFAVKRLMDADGTPIEESKQLLGNANVTVTFKNNQQGQTTMQVSNECLKNLSKGVYSVEEVDIPEDYYFKKLTDNTNNLGTNACVSKTDSTNKKVIFGIGMTAIPTNLSQPATLDTTNEARLSKRVGAVTYTNQQLSTISIIKKSTDAEGKDILLDGVEFKIEKKVGNSYEEVSRGDKTNYTVTTNDKGEAQFTGLEEGTYRITEIKAKNGYSLLANPIEVTLPYQVSGDSNAVRIDENKAVTYDGKENCYFDITYTIVNNKLFNMPASGGRFKATLIGIAVMIMAAGCYILRHRRKRII